MGASLIACAQTKILKVAPYIQLPADTVEAELLLNAFEAFLTEAQSSDEKNAYILENQFAETVILLDEVKNVSKSGKFQSDDFYKPYLTNIIRLNENTLEMHVSYLGVHENEAFLRASFEFIAHKKENQFYFSSSLKRNTEHWKTYRFGNAVFHYRHSINKKKAKEVYRLSAGFEQKLNSKAVPTEYYCCDNLQEVCMLMGATYKYEYLGKTKSVFTTTSGGKRLILLGNENATFENFDPHDLWHDCLSVVISRKDVNKSVDEACAYLYGGSWGLSWNEIWKLFLERVATNREMDWLHIKEKALNFADSKQEHLMADYVVTALIVDKVESERGFSGVWELLTSSKSGEGNEAYYRKLEELTGISKANYNEKIWELIDSRK